jgi:hypothetical protein
MTYPFLEEFILTGEYIESLEPKEKERLGKLRHKFYVLEDEVILYTFDEEKATTKIVFGDDGEAVVTLKNHTRRKHVEDGKTNRRCKYKS